MDQKKLDMLQKPFDPSEIEWRLQTVSEKTMKGLALAYVTNRAIQNRLDEVFGPLGWQNDFREWKNGNQLCGISVWDDEKQQWITKWDGAEDSKQDAVKGGLSDSMKRAGYQWGIGRYLYKLPSTWHPVKERAGGGKKVYYLDGTPKLPAWALPQNYTPSTVPPPVDTGIEPDPEDRSAEPLTETQLNVLYAKAKAHGYNVANVSDIAHKKYGIDNPRFMNQVQFTEMCNGFDSLATRAR